MATKIITEVSIDITDTLDEHKCTEHDGQFIGVVKLQDKTCYRDLREFADEVSEFKQQRRDYSRRTAAVGAYKTTIDNHKYDTSHYGRCVL